MSYTVNFKDHSDDLQAEQSSAFQLTVLDVCSKAEFIRTSSEINLEDYLYTGDIVAQLTHNTDLDTGGCELEYTCSASSFA